MLQQKKAEDYVIATGETHSIREFVELAFEQAEIHIGWQGKGVDTKGVDTKTGKTLVEISPEFFRISLIGLTKPLGVSIRGPIQVLEIMPGLTSLVLSVASIWMLVAMLIAVRQRGRGGDTDSPVRNRTARRLRSGRHAEVRRGVQARHHRHIRTRAGGGADVPRALRRAARGLS